MTIKFEFYFDEDELDELRYLAKRRRELLRFYLPIAGVFVGSSLGWLAVFMSVANAPAWIPFVGLLLCGAGLVWGTAILWEYRSAFRRAQFVVDENLRRRDEQNAGHSHTL